MTIVSMISLSALILVCLSHMAAIRSLKQEKRLKRLVPVRIHYTGRR